MSGALCFKIAHNAAWGHTSPQRFDGLAANTHIRDDASSSFKGEAKSSTHTAVPFNAAMGQNTDASLRPGGVSDDPRITVSQAPVLSHMSRVRNPGATITVANKPKISHSSPVAKISGIGKKRPGRWVGNTNRAHLT